MNKTESCYDPVDRTVRFTENVSTRGLNKHGTTKVVPVRKPVEFRDADGNVIDQMSRLAFKNRRKANKLAVKRDRRALRLAKSGVTQQGE